MSRCLEAALGYAARGWAVLPLWGVISGQCECPNGVRGCAQAGKHPIPEYAPHGYQSATTDAEAIRGWFTKYPTANVGIATGAVSGLVVIDEDPRNGGDVTREQLEAENRPIPQSLRQKTGGGGYHTLFKYPADGRLPDGERLVGKLGKGIDVKSDGGYIVASPSMHASGREYAWEDEDVSVVEVMPGWMLERLLRREEDGVPAADGEELDEPEGRLVADRKLRTAIKRVREGETRHGAMLWLAKQCRDNLVPRRVAEGMVGTFLAAANEKPGRHRFPRGEALAALKWAYATLPRRADAPRGVAEIAGMVSDIDRHRAAVALASEHGVPVRAVMADVRRLTLVPDATADWRQELIWRELANGGRRLEACVRNVEVCLTRHPEWAGKLRMNDLTMEVDLADGSPLGLGGQWTDLHTVKAAAWLQATMRLMVSPELVHHGVAAAADHAHWHPIKEYLGGLKWDGVERIDSWLEDCAGAVGSSVVRAMARRFLISAVARVMDPGCKVDHALILEGPQNIGKSTLMRELFTPWFADDIEVLGSKDSQLQLRGVWCVEIPELDAMHRSELSRTKAYMSRRVDRFRAPYGRRVEEWPRQVVLCGTTNRDQYLEDETGGRRFWTVRCESIDIEGLKAMKDQLWAEAMAAYAAGERWWLHEEELQKAAAREQDRRYHTDVWEEKLSEVTEERAWRVRWNGQDVPMTTANILMVMGVETPHQKRAEQMRVAACMKRLGFMNILHEEAGKVRLREWFKSEAEAKAIIRARRGYDSEDDEV